MINFDIPFMANSQEKLIEKIRNHPHKPLEKMANQEFRDIYEICMNKNYKTRPTAAELLSLDLI